MKFQNYFKGVKEFKGELDKLDWLSPREKEIVLDSWLKNPSLQLQKEESKKTKIMLGPEYEEIKANLPDSFASLVNKSKSNQHSDYVVLAMYHLIIQKEYESVSVKDIVDEYKKAYLKPSNTNVYLANLSRRGLLMPTEKKEGKAAFIITKDGINYVEKLISENGE